MIQTSTRWCAAVALLAASMASAQAADAYVSATVSGVMAPGVYGRINIGNAAPPPVIYSTPVVVTQPAYPVQRAPIYLYVPPGHARDWGRHCRHYNACNQPVYFVNVDNRGRYIRQEERREERREDRRDYRQERHEDRRDARQERREEWRDERGHGGGHGR